MEAPETPEPGHSVPINKSLAPTAAEFSVSLLVSARTRSIERLKQLAAASQSNNEFFAVHLPTKAVIAVIGTKK